MTEPNTANPNPDAERSAAASGETVKRTDGPAPAPLKSPVTSRPSSRRKRIISSVLFGAVALAGVLIVLYAWQLPPFTSPIQSTENAQVRGQTTLISPQLSGYVYEVPVQDFQFVKTGDLLVRLDDRIYK
ncbi:biotin/lipoyl-binding protein, partial [Pseudomonas viridiflava]